VTPLDIDPEAILEFWVGAAADDPAQAAARERFWFGAASETDALIRERFCPAIEIAARGDLAAWAHEARSALAEVLLLDQFPRNVWRGTASAFAHDGKALDAARAAVAAGHLSRLGPIEQTFLILPYEHSEAIQDQRESVHLSTKIAASAPEHWRALLERYSAFAVQHLEIIERFGRFPHRNRVLGRAATRAEIEYLRARAEGFGQG
jgi:uncharacterized protein (DUF924 family)